MPSFLEHTRSAWLVVALGSALLAACGSSDTSSNAGPGTGSVTAGARMCSALSDTVASCAAGPCEQALADDCTTLTGVLSEPYLGATAECMESGGAMSGCFASSLSALTPTEGQREFVEKFCNECPPVPIPGCKEALLGESQAPQELEEVRRVLTPLGDPVLHDIESQCFGGLTCLAELSSCVQAVLVARALPANTAQCLFTSLTSTPSTSAACGAGGSGGSESGGSGGTSGAAGGSGGSPGGAGGSPGGGGTGSGGSSGSGGSGGSVDCVDGYEPNATFATAELIDAGGDGKITDCEPPQAIAANVGAGDVDWYTFTGMDGVCFPESIQPHATVKASNPLEVCVYVAPSNDNSPTPTCLSGTPDDELLGAGFHGCCGNDEARLNFGNLLQLDDATVMIKVSTPKSACLSYVMEFGYGKS